MTLAAYRHVLRSARIAFQGDSRILSAARVEARCKFDKNRSLALHTPEYHQKIAEAEEVARILRQNIVQGEQLKGAGKEDQRYQLRIHEEIERGDNASIKAATTMTAAGASCCGGVS